MTLHIENLSKLRAALSAEGIEVPPYVTKKGLKFILKKHLESQGRTRSTEKPVVHDSVAKDPPLPADHFSSKSEWIAYLVCEEFKISEQTLISSRARIHSEIRHIAAGLIREHTNDSLICIGALLNRDYTTILHGIKRFNEDVSLKNEDRINSIKSKIPEYPH